LDQIWADATEVRGRHLHYGLDFLSRRNDSFDVEGPLARAAFDAVQLAAKALRAAQQYLVAGDPGVFTLTDSIAEKSQWSRGNLRETALRVRLLDQLVGAMRERQRVQLPYLQGKELIQRAKADGSDEPRDAARFLADELQLQIESSYPELEAFEQEIEQARQLEAQVRGRPTDRKNWLNPLWNASGTLHEGEALLKEIRDAGLGNRKWRHVRQGWEAWRDTDPLPMEESVLHLEARFRAIKQIAAAAARLAREAGDSELEKALSSVKGQAEHAKTSVAEMREVIFPASVDYRSRHGPSGDRLSPYLIARLQPPRFENLWEDSSSRRISLQMQDEEDWDCSLLLLRPTGFSSIQRSLSVAAQKVAIAAERGPAAEAARVRELEGALERDMTALAEGQKATARAQVDNGMEDPWSSL
jgi:hypothetical protein